MRRVLFLITFLFPLMALAQDEDIQENFKYTLLKTNSNYSPIRVDANVDSKRFSHLKSGSTLYSDYSNNNFFRIDLGLDKYYWIEKKYVEIQTQTADKELSQLKDITFGEDDKYYFVKIQTNSTPPYNEIETSDKSVDFIIYDAVIDDITFQKAEIQKSDFKISRDEFQNLKITFSSEKPLVGHEIISDDTGLILKVKKPFAVQKKHPLKNLTFVIDPGHGGKDSGACAFDLKEKDLNLQISDVLKNALLEEGATVYMTREDDIDVDLYDRVDFAKEKAGDFLLSIHQNSLPNRNKVNEKHGVGVYYYNKEAYNLAKEIQKSLVEKTGFRDDDVNFASFALTRSPNPLCVLIECGYIIHPEESKKLKDPEFQKIIADAIIEGVKNYVLFGNAD